MVDPHLNQNFYPRPPRGGRRKLGLYLRLILGFLSTPSARRATCQLIQFLDQGNNFYPRPPRGGRPGWCCAGPASPAHFYPRPPRGGRRHVHEAILRRVEISIHALREEGDPGGASLKRFSCTFLSTPSARRATTVTTLPDRDADDFYPRPPRGGRRGADKDAQNAGQISIHALREEGDFRLG